MNLRFKFALLAVAMMGAGCGQLEALQEELAARRAALREALEQQAEFAIAAQNLADMTDDMEIDVFDDETGLSSMPDLQGGAGPGMAPQDMVLAPAREGDGEKDVQVTRYTCGATADTGCFPSKVVVSESRPAPRGGEGEVTITSTAEFQYYSTLQLAVEGAAGDLNEEVLTRDAYVLMIFKVEHSRPTPEEGELTITTAGHRLFSLKPNEWYVVDTDFETTGFPTPRGDRPGVTKVRFTRSFAVPDTTATAGKSERVIEFSDDTTESTVRDVTFDRTTNVVSGTWIHEGRHGFVGEGEFEFDTKGTPRCRLDDVGSVSIERTFGEKVTGATSESIEIVKDGNTATLKGTLTMADGTTKEQSFTRTVVSPTSCGEPAMLREFTVTGTTYGGAEVEFTEIRGHGTLRFEGSRTLSNGNTQTIALMRADSVTTVMGSVADASGNTIATLRVVLQADGSGHGVITRTVDGQTLTKEFSIERGRTFKARD